MSYTKQPAGPTTIEPKGTLQLQAQGSEVQFKDSIQQLKQAMRIKPDFKPINIGGRHRVTVPSTSPKKLIASQG